MLIFLFVLKLLGLGFIVSIGFTLGEILIKWMASSEYKCPYAEQIKRVLSDIENRREIDKKESK